MKYGKLLAAGLTICSAMILTGCGGGSVDVTATVPVTPVAAFDIGALVNGQPVANFDVEPGDTPTLSIPVGDSLEFDSNAGVYWTIYVNGNAISGSNNSVTVDGATLTETSVTNAQFAGYVTSQGPLANPVQVTLAATSQIDGTQTAQINLVITN